MNALIDCKGAKRGDEDDVLSCLFFHIYPILSLHVMVLRETAMTFPKGRTRKQSLTLVMNGLKTNHVPCATYPAFDRSISIYSKLHYYNPCESFQQTRFFIDRELRSHKTRTIKFCTELSFRVLVLRVGVSIYIILSPAKAFGWDQEVDQKEQNNGTRGKSRVRTGIKMGRTDCATTKT